MNLPGTFSRQHARPGTRRRKSIPFLADEQQQTLPLPRRSRPTSGAPWIPILKLSPRVSFSLPGRCVPRPWPQPPTRWTGPPFAAPRQDRHSAETGLIDGWNPRGGEGSNLLWKRDDLGTRSTPIVMDGKLFLLARDEPGAAGEGEKVVCVDATDGRTLWEHDFNVYLSDVPDTRVAWSSCVGDPETGRVYAQGVCGYFCCLESDGTLVWERSLHEEFGLLSTFGGRTNLPLVFEDLVLTSAVVIGWGDTPEFGSLAKPAHRFMAFDKATGEIRWLAGTSISPYDTTYSTPTIAVIGGEQQLVFGSGDGHVWALQPRTGERIWNYPFSRRGLDASPLVVGNRVYMTQNQENLTGTAMGSVVALDATLRGDLSGKEIWRKYQVLAGKSGPVMVDGQLWVVDDGAKLHVFKPRERHQGGVQTVGPRHAEHAAGRRRQSLSLHQRRPLVHP